MKQEMTFIKKNGMKIQGLMYLPEKRGEKLPAVIFSHGFGSNFRELMHHGEGYAKSGICCLFFDFCGGGLQSLSDGVMPEMTLRSECEDLQTVLSCVKELDYVDPERIFLQGESMGGLVSALTAAKYTKDIRALILWYPAFCIPEDARIRLEKGEREVFGVIVSAVSTNADEAIMMARSFLALFLLFLLIDAFPSLFNFSLSQYCFRTARYQFALSEEIYAGSVLDLHRKKLP